MAEPLLVVGLGNPGPTYAKTRHNVGFMVADVLAARLGAPFKVHKKSGAEVATGQLAGRPVVLAKPRTYMNESGRQVGPLAKFYSVAPGDVIVLHDELDIDRVFLEKLTFRRLEERLELVAPAAPRGLKHDEDGFAFPFCFGLGGRRVREDDAGVGAGVGLVGNGHWMTPLSSGRS